MPDQTGCGRSRGGGRGASDTSGGCHAPGHQRTVCILTAPPRSGVELTGPCVASSSRAGAGLAGCRVTACLIHVELVSGTVLDGRRRETGLQYAALQDSMRLADLAADGDSELADRSGAGRSTKDGGRRAEARTVTTDGGPGADRRTERSRAEDCERLAEDCVTVYRGKLTVWSCGEDFQELGPRRGPRKAGERNARVCAGCVSARTLLGMCSNEERTASSLIKDRDGERTMSRENYSSRTKRECKELRRGVWWRATSRF